MAPSKYNMFSPSKNLLIKIADRYYNQGLNQQAIAKEFELSCATVSRMLQMAKSEGIVQISLHPSALNCLRLEEKIRSVYPIEDIIVTPFDHPKDAPRETLLQSTETVGLETARYLQRMALDASTIGVSWGGTVCAALDFLNPSQRSSVKVVTMTGGFSALSLEYDTPLAAKKLAKIFNAENYIITADSYQPNDAVMEYFMSQKKIQEAFHLFDQIDVSVSGVGSMFPTVTSTIFQEGLLASEYMDRLIDEYHPYGDIAGRFFDENGVECNSPLKDHTLSISMEQYKAIPHKIVCTGGPWKADTVIALLKGGLADILIIDQILAEAIVEKL